VCQATTSREEYGVTLFFITALARPSTKVFGCLIGSARSLDLPYGYDGLMELERISSQYLISGYACFARSDGNPYQKSVLIDAA